MFQWHQESYLDADERLGRLLLDSKIRADALVVSEATYQELCPRGGQRQRG